MSFKLFDGIPFFTVILAIVFTFYFMFFFKLLIYLQFVLTALSSATFFSFPLLFSLLPLFYFSFPLLFAASSLCCLFSTSRYLSFPSFSSLLFSSFHPTSHYFTSCLIFTRTHFFFISHVLFFFFVFFFFTFFFFFFGPYRAWSKSVYMASDDPLPSLIRDMIMEEASEEAGCKCLPCWIMRTYISVYLIFFLPLISFLTTSLYLEAEDIVMMIILVYYLCLCCDDVLRLYIVIFIVFGINYKDRRERESSLSPINMCLNLSHPIPSHLISSFLSLFSFYDLSFNLCFFILTYFFFPVFSFYTII